jgi:hypothetical protein
MRTARSRVIVTLLTVVVAGCFPGTGSELTGIAGGNGGSNTGGRAVLAFFVQPNSANVGQVISPPVEVVVRDTLGSTDSSFTGTVSVALASNATGATLSGTTALRPVNGIASFSNLAVDEEGTYTLSASASGAATVTSSAFTITTVTGQ